MVISERHHRFPAAAALHSAPAVVRDIPFETRWAAWVERGRDREQRGRRRYAMLAAAIAAAAIAYAFLV